MKNKIFKRGEEILAGFYKRTDKREETLMNATMSFVGYFVGLGDDQATAESKVSQMSTECAAFTHVYTMGNITALTDAIQTSNLAFMDQAAKDFIIGELTV